MMKMHTYTNGYRWIQSGNTSYKVTDLTIVYKFMGIVMHAVTIPSLTWQVVHSIAPKHTD
jgi:hypothetical protein